MCLLDVQLGLSYEFRLDECIVNLHIFIVYVLVMLFNVSVPLSAELLLQVQIMFLEHQLVIINGSSVLFVAMNRFLHLNQNLLPLGLVCFPLLLQLVR